VLPKEKKQKEEKIQTYGQSVFELFSLLKGDLLYTAKLPVYPTPGSTLEQQPAMTVSLEAMYALPDSWMNPAREYAYTVSLPLPINEDKDGAIAFVNGLQKTSADPIVKQKRLGDTRGIQATQAIYMAQPTIVDDPSIEDLGDFSTKEEKEYRTTSERERPRISWNTERRCFLSQASNNM